MLLLYNYVLNSFKLWVRVKFILLGCVNDTQFLSAGAVGHVYRINWYIAVKIPLAEGQGDLSHENAILDELDREPHCTEIVQSFLRLPTANFMAFYSGGTLEQHLGIYQIRHEINGDQVILVRRKESTHLVYRWMREVRHWINDLLHD